MLRRRLLLGTALIVALIGVMLVLLPSIIVEDPPIFLSAAITNDGSQLLLGSHQGQIAVWDINERHELFVTEVVGSDWMRDITCAPDSRTIAIRGTSSDGFQTSVLRLQGETWDELASWQSDRAKGIRWPSGTEVLGVFRERESNDEWDWVSLGGEPPEHTPRVYTDANRIAVGANGDTLQLNGELLSPVDQLVWDIDTETVIAVTRDEILIWKGFANDPKRLPREDVDSVHLFGSEYCLFKRWSSIALHSVPDGALLSEYTLEGFRVEVSGTSELILDYGHYDATLIGLVNEELVKNQTISVTDTSIRPHTTWQKIQEVW